jgi:hypothetical protein
MENKYGQDDGLCVWGGGEGVGGHMHFILGKPRRHFCQTGLGLKEENQREIQGRMSLVRTIFRGDKFMQTYIKTLRDTLAQAQ